MEDVELRICGDWAPGSVSVFPLRVEGPFLVNIEGPILGESLEPFAAAPKAGPHLYNCSLPESHYPIVAILANNHLFDYGLQGYLSTREELEQRAIAAVGAGTNDAEAKRPLSLTFGNIRVGILARSERQFGVAARGKSGVAGFDASLFAQINELKKEHDVVIVSMHGGAELVPWPSPSRQLTYQSLVDAGADIVYGHHSHVPQGWEIYKDRFIFYGLGNFCVDPAKWSWHPHGLWSLSPKIHLSKKGIELKILTTVIEQKNERIIVRESNSSERE